MGRSMVYGLVVLLVSFNLTYAHSWIEQLTLIDSAGLFTGTPGYPRAFIPRTATGFTDTSMTHILPPADPLEARSLDTQGISPTDPMCRKSQQSQSQAANYPRLQVAPNSWIALRYEENGHVSLPQNQKGKPANRGTVYIYGTTQPKSNENFLDVFKQWNEEGTGGDKRGRLLATQPYDDGRCHQVNSGAISQQRQQQYPHDSNGQASPDLLCQNDIRIPSDVPDGKPYTLYWVWDWPTAAGVDPGLPVGKAEIYTSCMDVDIKIGARRRSLNEIRAVAAVNYNSMAIPSYMSSSSTSSSQTAPAAAPSSASATIAQSMPTPVATAVSDAASMNINSAESEVLSFLGAQLMSEIKKGATTVTVTVVEGSAAAATSVSDPTTSSIQSYTTIMKTRTRYANPAATTSALAAAAASDTNANTDANTVPSMPPSILSIGAPIMSPIAAAAAAATSASAIAPASASPSASFPAEASSADSPSAQVPNLGTFTGTATPDPTGTGPAVTAVAASSAAISSISQAVSPAQAVKPRSCRAGKCRMAKRSRIFTH